MTGKDVGCYYFLLWTRFSACRWVSAVLLLAEPGQKMIRDLGIMWKRMELEMFVLLSRGGSGGADVFKHGGDDRSWRSLTSSCISSLGVGAAAAWWVSDVCFLFFFSPRSFWFFVLVFVSFFYLFFSPFFPFFLSLFFLSNSIFCTHDQSWTQKQAECCDVSQDQRSNDFQGNIYVSKATFQLLKATFLYQRQTLRKWRQCWKMFLDTGMEQVDTILNRIELRKWRNERTTEWKRSRKMYSTRRWKIGKQYAFDDSASSGAKRFRDSSKVLVCYCFPVFRLIGESIFLELFH